MSSPEEPEEILERALGAAEGDEADAILISTDRNVSRFANSTLNQNMSEIASQLTLRVLVGGKMGVSSTTSLSEEEVRRTASLAREMANRSDPLPKFNGLYRGRDSASSLRAFDASTAALSARTKAERLREVFERGHAKGLRFAGSYTSTAGSVSAGNSHGVRRFSRFTALDAVLIAIGANDSGFASGAGREDRSVDVIALGGEAIEKATLEETNLGEIEPGEYDVILEPPALAEIFEWLNMIAFSGRSYEEESSFFAGHIGERMLSEKITLANDPLDEDFLPFPFDAEGVPARRVALVERGTIRTAMFDKILADRFGVEPTGSAAALGSEDHGMAMHLSVSGGSATREELIASTKRGVWVTRFHYVNGLLEPKSALMTGMTRDGTFLIENGRVTRRLKNLRWTQSMVEAFSSVEGITAERRRVATWWNLLGGTIAPTIKIRNWKFTGISRQ